MIGYDLVVLPMKMVVSYGFGISWEIETTINTPAMELFYGY